jgi:hypothetical protein
MPAHLARQLAHAGLAETPPQKFSAPPFAAVQTSLHPPLIDVSTHAQMQSGPALPLGAGVLVSTRVPSVPASSVATSSLELSSVAGVLSLVSLLEPALESELLES